MPSPPTFIIPGIAGLYGAGDITTGEIILQPGVDWLNIAAIMGASSPIGATDFDTVAVINGSLAGLPPGSVAYLQTGLWPISAPIVVPPGVELRGSEGCDQDNFPTNDTTFPFASGSVIKPLASFSGAAVIEFNDVGHAMTQGPRLRSLAIDGSNLVAANVDGIRATGPVLGAILEDVFIHAVTGVGINCLTDASATGQTFPYGWHMRHVKISNSALQGIVCSNHSDATWIDVHTIGTVGHGWSIAGPMPNSRLIGCKAEWAGSGKDGFHLTGSWSTGTGSGGLALVGCSTDRNDGNGIFINATGNDPILLSGCQFRRDGRNGGSGGGGFAGINIDATGVPVFIDGCCTYPGVNDDGTGTNSPQIGAFVHATPALAALSGCYLHAATTGLSWDSTGVLSTRGVYTRTGSTASPGSITAFTDTA
jgi:hypothetical protein